MKPPRLLSQEKPIKQIPYDDLPTEWWNEGKEGRRKIAHEEASRDLDKEPERLLVDIQDESLDPSRRDGENIARVLARMSSMQLQIDKKAGKLNVIVFWLGLAGILLALIATVSTVIQTYYTVHPPAKVEVVQPTTPQK